MLAIDRLHVIWSEPRQGSRYVIGRLERAGGEIRYWYEPDLGPAFAAGFQLLPEFPEHRTEQQPYAARYLFPLFAERIPSLARADAKAMLGAWGVDRPDDQFEVLAKSGGIRATDRIELAEYRTTDDDLTRPFEFRVASRSRIPDAAPLAVDAMVSLRREPTNEADPLAVIVDRNGRRAGYVPRYHTGFVHSLFDRGIAFEGRVVRELVLPDDVGKWVVRISRRG